MLAELCISAVFPRHVTLANTLLTTLQEKVASATIDEELARDPEMAKQIDQEISEGNFIP